MNDIIYEPHDNKDSTNPFIFHIDTLSRSYSDAVTTLPEEVSVSNISLLHFRNKCLQNWHENIEILYIAKGSGTLYSNSRTYSLKEGDIAVISSFDLHYVEANDYIVYFCLIPDKAFLDVNGIDISDTFFTPIINDETSKDKFSRIISEFSSNSSYSEAGRKASVLDFVLYIARHYTEPTSRKKTSKSLNHIRLAIGYINSHLSDRLSSDAISFEVGLSRYHFLREFKKITGYTLVSFINNMRCEKARALLSGTSLTITDICSECGFENNSYFTRVFRKETGMSPSEYRKLCLSELKK